jgi:hypothetical protein
MSRLPVLVLALLFCFSPCYSFIFFVVLPIPQSTPERYSIKVYFKSGLTKCGKSPILFPDELNDEEINHLTNSMVVINNRKVRPQETDSIVADDVVGMPDSGRWLFKVSEGAITLYSLKPSTDTTYFACFTKNGQLSKFSTNNVRESVRDDNIALLTTRVVGNFKPDVLKAIEFYNNPGRMTYRTEIDSMVKLVLRNPVNSTKKFDLVRFYRKTRTESRMDSLNGSKAKPNWEDRLKLYSQMISSDSTDARPYAAIGDMYDERNVSDSSSKYYDLFLRYSDDSRENDRMRDKIRLFGKSPSY